MVMIGSVSQLQQEMAAQEARRQAIAAQAVQASVPAAAPTVSQLAGAMPAAGSSAPMAFKASEPDIAKKRKGKDRAWREGRDMLTAEGGEAADTGPRAVAEGMRDAQEAETARKAWQDRGITEGPTASTVPARPGEAEQFDRPYLSEGHGAPAPMSEAPRTSPIQHGPQGQVTDLPASVMRPIEMSSTPAIAGNTSGPLGAAVAAHWATPMHPPMPGGTR